MSLINVSHLTFAYDGSYDDVFTDVSFQLDTDWKLGFCGRNGRGKTTFLNLLMGKYEYRGTITASVEFEYFPFPVADASRNTLDVLSAIAPGAELWRVQKELSKLAVDEEALYRPFATLSNGERTKALLAGLFLRENNFPLIDEPTNHLDMAARETVARYLNGKQGFILVSHDRAFLDGCIDHVLSINRADIEITNGNFSTWFRQKQLKDDFELSENERLKKDIKRLAAAAREKAVWSDSVEKSKHERPKSGLDPARGHIGRMAAKMMKRSKSIERRKEREIDEKSTLLKNIESAETLKLHPLEYHSARLITLQNVGVSYGSRQVVGGVSLALERGDRIALLGGNGSGKSTLLKLILGGDIAHSGQVSVASGLVISYVPQDASFLCGDLDAFAREKKIDATLLKTILRKLDFSRIQFEKDMRDYSAGQKKKVLLAASLCEKAHVYVWDEPLNYIDVLSRMQIERLITDFRPTLLFAEHDRAFCGTVATKTVELEGTRLSRGGDS
ncbi:MAG: ABC-F type ribosomal protection protein [Oscillospiraceae bacterium]|nr:ABC-F type ribosomal protection protein [Oscillospiraceae bacterium]